MRRNTLIIVLNCLLFTSLCTGQIDRQYTKSLPEGSTSPAASIQDVAWIQGHWVGQGLGGETEEIWSPPSAGSMMGSFRLIENNTVSFYEFCLIREIEGTLLMQIKHFDNELVGWETKEVSVDFPLVEITDEAAYFDGLTFFRKGKNKLSIYVLLDESDEASEFGFEFTRKNTND